MAHWVLTSALPQSITNYAPVFLAQQQAKKAGFSEAVFLDASNKYVEEVGAANFFCLGKDGVIRTPGTRMSIL